MMAAESQQEQSADTMDRTTLRAPPVLLDALEAYARDMGYASPSEAHRHAIRRLVPDHYFNPGPAECDGGGR